MSQIAKGDVVSFPGADGDEIGQVSSIYHDGANGFDRASIENDDGSWSHPAISQCTFIRKGNSFLR